MLMTIALPKYTCIRQHASAPAYVSIRQHLHTSAYVRIRTVVELEDENVDDNRVAKNNFSRQSTVVRQHMLAYVSNRQHTSAYVSRRRLPSPASPLWCGKS